MRRALFLLTLALLLCRGAALGQKAEPDKKPAKPTVSGEITFKNQPTFAKGTEVLVQVQDTSLADAKAKVLGKQVIKDPMKVPIPFAVEYDDKNLRARARITLSVRITLKGKLLYINDTSIPVVNPPGKTKGVQAPVIKVGK